MFYNIGSRQKWASVIFKSFEEEVTGNDFFFVFLVIPGNRYYTYFFSAIHTLLLINQVYYWSYKSKMSKQYNYLQR